MESAQYPDEQCSRYRPGLPPAHQTICSAMQPDRLDWTGKANGSIPSYSGSPQLKRFAADACRRCMLIFRAGRLQRSADVAQLAALFELSFGLSHGSSTAAHVGLRCNPSAESASY